MQSALRRTFTTLIYKAKPLQVAQFVLISGARNTLLYNRIYGKDLVLGSVSMTSVALSQDKASA